MWILWHKWFGFDYVVFQYGYNMGIGRFFQAPNGKYFVKMSLGIQEVSIKDGKLIADDRVITPLTFNEKDFIEYLKGK